MEFPLHVQELLKKRYFLNGEAFFKYYGYEGEEDWIFLCTRVASTVAKNQKDRDLYFNMIHDLYFIPNSPTLFGAGLDDLCLSACFVVNIEDSIDGWANAFHDAMKIQTAGGGIGFPLHHIRPSGMNISKKRAKSAGPIEFMKCWNQISKSLSQAVRNGANMGFMLVNHPDIEDFIECKDKDGELSNFNISVGITEDFMTSVKMNSDFNLIWNDKIVKKINARKLYDKICHHAWKTGEPGIIFFDEIQKFNKHPEFGNLYVNPCLHGDTLISTKEFGSIKISDLASLRTQVITYDFDGKGQKIDHVWYSGFKECVEIKLKNDYKIICTPDHQFMADNGKWYQAKNLAGKKLKYVPLEDWKKMGWKRLENSKDCYKDFNKVMEVIPVGKHDVYDFSQPETNCGAVYGFITHNCGEYNGYVNSACNLGSINLTKFVDQHNKFDYKKFEKIIKRSYKFLDDLIDANHYPTEKIHEVSHKFRPIGLGVMGLADVFVKMGIKYGSKESIDLTHQIFQNLKIISNGMNEELGDRRGNYPAYGMLRKPGSRRNLFMNTCAPTGSISLIAGCSQGIEPIFSFDNSTRIINGKPYSIPNKYEVISEELKTCSANKLSPESHIDIVSAAQKYIDMSISKTINLQSDAKLEEVSKIILKAYESKLKGVTVYRDGCRENQTIQTESSYKFKTNNQTIKPIKRIGILSGQTFKDKIACGYLYTTVNVDKDKNILEVFIRPGKHGGCQSNVEAMARLISLALRCKVDIAEIVDQLKGIRCPACMGNKDKGIKYASCADSVAKAIEYVEKHKTIDEIFIVQQREDTAPPITKSKGDGISTCPDCGHKLIYIEGCRGCSKCDWSKCG